jgi:hypothetical protein
MASSKEVLKGAELEPAITFTSFCHGGMTEHGSD